MQKYRCAAPRVAALVAAVASLASSAAAQDFSKFKAPAEGSSITVDHGPWTKLLQSYVVAGEDGVNRVRYAALKADGHAALKAYVKSLEATEVSKLNRNEQFAYWSNLYNAKTIDIVADSYPVKSIKDISLGGGVVATITGGPWKAKVLTVEGQELSLDDIEHKILRGFFKDPRVHYAVNCASFGCPNLRQEAFTGAALEKQLDDAAGAYINHPRGFSIEDKSVRASSIYKWFAEDFGGNVRGVLAHAGKYAGDELKRKLKSITEIEDYGYDWGLNDAPTK